jgi:hypothetical protein
MRLALLVILALALALVHGKEHEGHLKASSSSKKGIKTTSKHSTKATKTCDTQCLDTKGPGGHSPSVCGHNKAPPADELMAYQSIAGVDQACCCMDCAADYPNCYCYTSDDDKCILYTEKDSA